VRELIRSRVVWRRTTPKPLNCVPKLPAAWLVSLPAKAASWLRGAAHLSSPPTWSSGGTSRQAATSICDAVSARTNIVSQATKPAPSEALDTHRLN